jgi:uncharacterized protein with ParB-like and HNH nuclease domain
MSTPVYQSILTHTISNTNQVRYKIDPRTINDFFTAGLTQEKRIPDYQRPYSWEEQNVKQLFEDIYSLSKKSTAEKSWFLGPVFTTYVDGDDFSYLLDGQQRSTTIMLVLKEFTLLQFKINEYSFGSNNKHLKDRFDKNIKTCYNCLTYTKGPGKELTRLITEISSQEFFETYISSAPQDESELIHLRKELSDYADKLKAQGSNTAHTINKNTVFLNKLYQKLIEDTVFPENMENINSFIEALLFHCWLIEIPIKEDEYSINIFESINNRGRKLTLVDKLRFRTLILARLSTSRDKIKSLWKEVFSDLERMQSFNFIKDEEDFFKVLVNSLSGHGFTKESDMLEYFEMNNFKSDDDIIKFLEDCKRVIQANLIVREALEPTSTFVGKFKKSEQNKVRAILLLCEKMFKASDNSRFLYYRNALENYTPTSNYPFVMSLWNNIRLTVFQEIFVSESSNIVREEYLKVIKSQASLNSFIKTDYIKTNHITLYYTASYQLNFISNKNPDKIQLLLSLYSYFMDYNTLVNTQSNLFLKHVEVEHCIPKKWKKNWTKAKFNFDDAENYLNNYNYKQFTPAIEFNNIKQIIIGKGPELELPDDEAPGQNCILEFIGNKWMIHSSDNKKGSNLSWQEKRTRVFENTKALKFPDNDDPLAGYKLYNEFTFAEILDRSLRICNKIVEEFQTPLF